MVQLLKAHSMLARLSMFYLNGHMAWLYTVLSMRPYRTGVIILSNSNEDFMKEDASHWTPSVFIFEEAESYLGKEVWHFERVGGVVWCNGLVCSPPPPILQLILDLSAIKSLRVRRVTDTNVSCSACVCTGMYLSKFARILQNNSFMLFPNLILPFSLSSCFGSWSLATDSVVLTEVWVMYAMKARAQVFLTWMPQILCY